MISAEEFEHGLRLDQYMASLERNKENFRANFIKAIEMIPADDLAFFRKLPKTNILVVTDDDNADALRDVPIISRVSVEVGSLKLRIFRQAQHMQLLTRLGKLVQPEGGNAAAALRSPIYAFFTPQMELISIFAERLPELSDEMQRRRQEWVTTHPEIRDASEPLDKMLPLTRTRLLQTLYAMTPDQRTMWGRKTVKAWRQMLESVR